MSLQSKQFYDFANFRLDISEKILLREGKPVPLTPKVFDTLCVLVENAGRLLEKDEMMRKIWCDRFVEEGNLAFNIKVIRKALGDSATQPRFIKTVQRRGYRFIAEVKPISVSENSTKKFIHSEFQETLVKEQKKNRAFPFLLFPLAAILLICVTGFGWWFVSGKYFSSTAQVLHESFSSEKISTDGKVSLAALSPDGRQIVYVKGRNSEPQSIWLRQIETGNNIEIIPPSENVYGGLIFSPDGKFIYFARRPHFAESQLDIYRVPSSGGIPQKIIKQTQGWMSVSADETRISFVRCENRNDEYCSLWIADAADGANERKITARPRPIRIADNKFSPDGKRIGFAVGQSENSANEFSLMEIDLENGQEREISAKKFFNIKSISWLPDASGLLIAASVTPNKNFRIWQVSGINGEVQPLTKDSENYAVLSLDKAAEKIVATQVKQNFRLRLVNAENPAENRFLADATMVKFAPDGKVYFSSTMSGNEEIWMINADGSEQKQLTNNPADETSPVISPGNETIYFASNRTGAIQVWRMNKDGSGQTQVTQKEGGFPIGASDDGEWIYYHHGMTRTLWRVSSKTGNEESVLDKSKNRFAVSPDGKQVAYCERNGDERSLIVASLSDGKILKSFLITDKKLRVPEIVWLASGKSFAYLTSNTEANDNILWIQSLDKATPHRVTALINEKTMESLSLSAAPDGKTFAVVQGNWLHDAVLLKGLR